MNQNGDDVFTVCVIVAPPALAFALIRFPQLKVFYYFLSTNARIQIGIFLLNLRSIKQKRLRWDQYSYCRKLFTILLNYSYSPKTSI